MSAGLTVEAVKKRYAGTAALDDVSVEVAAGAYAVVLGPSGSGKSTLLGLLGGFIDPDAGRVLIDGRDVTPLAPVSRPTTTVFQDYALFPHMDLADNVAFGLRMRGWTRAVRRARAAEMLSLVGLDGAERRRPHALSGGQRQRVALARALAVEPQVLLLDEPLGALDLGLRRAMQRELKAIQQRLGTTFVHVTHDQEEAMAIADTVVVMQAGRVADAGPPDRVYLRPANAFTAGFMGEINLLPARIEATGPDGTVLDTPLGRCQVLEPPPAGPQLRIGVRPEQLKLAVGRSDEEATMVFEAAVIESVFAGPHQRARLQIADGTEIVAQLPQSFAAAPEARVSLQLKTSDLILLSDSEA